MDLFTCTFVAGCQLQNKPIHIGLPHLLI